MRDSDPLAREIAKRSGDPMQALSKASRITNPNLDIANATPMRGEMPLGPRATPMLESLGKPVSEMLGAVFQLKNGTGLPSLMRVSNWNPRTGSVLMQSIRKASEAFEATPAQLDEMMANGWLDLKQPAQRAGERITSLLQSAMGK